MASFTTFTLPRRSRAATPHRWSTGIKIAAGVGIAGIGVGGYWLYRHIEATAAMNSGATGLGASTPSTPSTPTTGGTTFTVQGMALRTRATQVGYPLQVVGTVSPTLTGSGAVLTVTDQTGTTLATVSKGTTITVNITESTAGVYGIRWAITENGATIVQSPSPLVGYWIDPSATNAISLFAGSELAMQDYLNAWPYQPGVASASNIFSYTVQNTLAGTEFGYTVAGLQHTVTNGIVTNTVLAIPFGAKVTYVAKGTDPVLNTYTLIGKMVNGHLWQVYAQAPSTSTKGSGSTSGSGSGSTNSTTLAQAQAQYASLTSQYASLTSQSNTNTQTLAALEAQLTVIQTQLAALKTQ